METETKTARTGGSVREVVYLAWPIIISMLSYTAMGVVDTIFVGWVGKTELAAVGLATTAIFLVNSFFMGILNGVKIVSAQATGAKEHEIAKASGWQGALLAIPFGLIVIFMGSLHEPIFALMGGPSNVQVTAGDYFVVRVFSAPVWYVTIALVNAFQGTGDTKTPMRINILANCLNIILDPIFIFGLGPVPEMGVAGAALATVIACAISMSYAVIEYSRKMGFSLKIKIGVLKSIFRLGLPNGIRFFLDVGGWTLFTAILARMGEDELAANQIAIKIISLSFLPGYALSETACILTGQYVGADNISGARNSFRSATKAAVVVMTFFGLLFWFIPDLFLRCFQDDEGVLTIGRSLLSVAAVFQIFDAFAMVATGALNGVGDTRYTMVVSVLASWFVMVPLAYLFGVIWEMGAFGAWIGLTGYIILLSIVLTLRFQGDRWQKLPSAVT